MTKHLLIFCAAACLALTGCVATGGDSAGSGASAAGSESEVVPYIPPLPGANGS